MKVNILENHKTCYNQLSTIEENFIMTTKMTKKNAEAIAYFENTVLPMINYQEINKVIDYLKDTDFTPKQIEKIHDIIEDVFSPLSDIKNNKSVFNPDSQFAFIVPYILEFKVSVKNSPTNIADIEELCKNILSASKKNYVSYLTTSFILNMENRFNQNYEKNIIAELDKLAPEEKYLIKTHFQRTVESLNTINSSNINQLKWLLDRQFITVNDFYGDQTLAFMATDIPVLSLLKERHADFSLTNSKNETCVFYNKNTEALKFLISEGCDINHINQYGKHAGFYLIKDKNFSIKDIFDIGVNLHHKDNEGCSMLNYTISLQQANELLERGVFTEQTIFYSKDVAHAVKTYKEKEVLQNEVSPNPKNKNTLG